MGETLLASTEMTTLLTLVEEATRSTTEGVQFFVEPAEDALRRATSRRHHIVFGRRGSGKSSLLRKAAANLTRERRPMAWVDLEGFKGHSYPDLLISVLIKTLEEFKGWLETAATAPANKKSLWKKWFGGTPSRPPFDKKSCADLIATISQHLVDLSKQLHSADDAEIETTHEYDETAKDSATATISGGVKTPVANMSSSIKSTAERQHQPKSCCQSHFAGQKLNSFAAI